jgi:regulator of sigma E protease
MILASPGKVLNIEVTRDGKRVVIPVKPVVNEGRAMIGIAPVHKQVPVGFRDSVVRSVELPAIVVKRLVESLGRIILGREKPQLTGPVGIVREAKRAAERSFTEYLTLLAILSAYLGGFNLLPFPALDGGRLSFLAYEAVTRRKPNARVEAQVHAVGLLMLLALIFVVSSKEIFTPDEPTGPKGVPSASGAKPPPPPPAK